MTAYITKKTTAWALYDFADTAFSALFITFFFPILIKVHLGGNEFHIGLAFGLSVAAAAVLLPLIGALSDITGRRMPLLIAATLATAALVVFTGYAGLAGALVFGFFARLTNLVSKKIYDAKMTDLVPSSQYGILSGFGVGAGYLGAIAALAAAYPLLSYFGWESVVGIQAVFLEVAVFYLVFALPFFILVKDKVERHTQSISALLQNGFRAVLKTMRTLPRIPVFSRFLAASFFYNNGMSTVIIFLALYGREVIGLGIRDFFPVYAVMAIAAGAGAFFIGRLSNKFGPALLIKRTLAVWIGIIALLMTAPSYSLFIALGMLGGAALGIIWTLNRHMVAKISPREHIAERFGFEGLTEKLSGLLGPVVFGALVVFSGYTLALASVITFIAFGLFLMRKIPNI